MTQRGATHGDCSALLPQIVIGSKHLRKQYKLHGEQAFHPSDVPAKARQAKHEAKAWARHSALAELAKPQWNGSTSTGQPLCKRTSRLLASVRGERSAAFLLAISASCPRCPAQHEPREYQHNFRAEQLPPSRPVSRDAFGRTKLLRMDARSSQVRRRAVLAYLTDSHVAHPPSPRSRCCCAGPLEAHV